MNKLVKKATAGLVFGAVLMSLGLANAQSVTQTSDLNVTGLGVTETTSESVSLVWDEIAIAESYTVEYGTEPVVQQGDTYNLPPEETDVNQITIDGLTPNTTYYFSVIAFGENRQSASEEYSTEVSATTVASEGFDVDEVEVVDAGRIEITMSEEVVLPENAREEVTIRLLQSPSNTLNVTEVRLKENENNTLVVNTDAQSPNSMYVLELSELFVNASGEAIQESSRTQEFTGYDAANSDDTTSAMTGLRIDNIKAINVNGMSAVELDFNADLDLDENDLSSFTIVKKNDPNQFLSVNEIKPNNQDLSKYLLVTDSQEVVTYSLILTALESVDGQTMSDDNSIVDFQGVAQDDTTEEPDQDMVMLENLRIETLESGVRVLWDVPSSEMNVSEIRIYLSTDNGENFTVLRSNVNPADGAVTLSDLKSGTDNQLKISVVADGSETAGQVIEFELAETGPATSLALVLTFALGCAYGLRRKNQFGLVDHS